MSGRSLTWFLSENLFTLSSVLLCSAVHYISQVALHLTSGWLGQWQILVEEWNAEKEVRSLLPFAIAAGASSVWFWLQSCSLVLASQPVFGLGSSLTSPAPGYGHTIASHHHLLPTRDNSFLLLLYLGHFGSLVWPLRFFCHFSFCWRPKVDSVVMTRLWLT